MVCLLCHDDSQGGGKLVRNLVPLKHFDPYYREVAEAASSYIERYGKVPGEHTLDLFDGLTTRKKDNKDIYRRLYLSLESTKGKVNQEYILAQAKLFVRYQKVRRGLSEAVDFLELDDESGLLQAESALQKSLEQSHDLFDVGTILQDPKRSLAFLDSGREAMITGIPQLDAAGLGPARKRLHLFIGLPKSGKSWWLVNLTKWAFLSRLRVVYITLELDEPEVMQRIIQSFFSVGKRDQIHKVQRFTSDELGRFVSMDPKLLKDRPHLKQKNVRRFLEGKLGEIKHRPPVVVRQFPTGSLTINELEAYLDALEAAKGIIPDLLIVDYADLMTVDAANLRIELGQLYKKLRGIAVKRNIAIATASQSNREGRNARTITDRNVSEDYSKIATVDVAISHNQTEAEKDLGLARLFVVAARTDADKFTTLISQAYSLGQFCMDSVGMVNKYWDQLKEAEAD